MSMKLLKDEKFLAFVGGVLAATYGVKALKSDKARKLCVNGLAAGIRMQQDAQETFQNMKEEAEDLCHDAKVKNCCESEQA